MPGIFSDVDQQNQMSAATAAPVAAPVTSAWDAASADMSAYLRYKSSSAQTLNQYDFIQSKMDDYEKSTGEKLGNNPGFLDSTDPMEGKFYAQRTQELRDKFAEKGMTFPSDQEIEQGGIGIARAALSRQEQADQGAQGPGSSVARFGAGVVEQVGEPSNGVALAVIPEAGLGVKMLSAAGAFGGAALYNDLSRYDYQKKVTPALGPGDVVKDVALQAAGGAAFELGGKLVGDAAGALWRRFKGVAPEVANHVPQDIQDAGNVAERVADWNAQNPFHGADGAAAHNEAIGKVEQDMLADRSVQLPPSAQEATAAPGITPEDIAAHARGTNPVLFDLTDKLEGQIADVRAKIGEVAGSAFEKDIPVEQELRVQLNELQQQRAAMGPEVNAARQDAQQFLASHPTEAAPLAPREAVTEPAAAPTAKDAYGDPVTIDAAAAHPFKNINRMADALEGSAEAWSAMRAAAKRGDIPATQDITPHVMMAVKALVNAKDEGKTLGQVMNEGPEFQSDTGQLAAGLFFDKDSGKFLSKAQMTTNLKSLADDLRMGPKVEKGAEPSALPAAARPTAEEIAKAPIDPKVHDSMVADLQRNIEQGRNRVPSYDASGKVQAGVADSELAAIERQEAAANEIANCTAPVKEAAE